MNIHVWVPDYASSMGGIQTLSRFVVHALRECLPTAEISVFAKNDTSPPEDTSVARFFSTGRWSRRFRTAAFAAQVFTHACRDRPSLIWIAHANFAPVAAWLQKLFGIPYVVIGNGIEVWEISDRRVRSALCSATKLLAISEFTRGRMAAALQIAPQAISVFPCTFDQHRYVPGDKPPFLLDRYRLSREQPIILTIARLAAVEQYKGYDQVLRALPGLRARFPEIRYILGGKGPDRPRVEELAATLGVKENVIFPGYIPDDELCSYYNLCDVFAMPSRGEGFGIVFLEAASCGKAVLAGNKDGSVDALLGGEIGALVDPEDVEEIELTLAQLLTGTHPNCNLRDPVFLRARAIDALGYERFVERVREVLKSIYSKTRARSS